VSPHCHDVVGSYAIPAWLWAAWEKLEAGGFGAMDLAETENDAVETAIRDQERAGVDVISDGEMRRQGFIVSIFKYFHGLKPKEPRRKVGVLSYDGHVFYEPVERISAPEGLGALKELEYLRRATTRPFKITLPGPLTLATQIPGAARTAIGSRSHRTWRRSSTASSGRSRPVARGTSSSTTSTRVFSWSRSGSSSSTTGASTASRWSAGSGTLLRHAGGFGYGERRTGRCSRRSAG